MDGPKRKEACPGGPSGPKNAGLATPIHGRALLEIVLCTWYGRGRTRPRRGQDLSIPSLLCLLFS